MTTHHPAARTYRVVLDGHLDDHWAARLGGHALVRHGDGTTTLTTGALDQARLHGTLTAIRDIGVPLLELTPETAPGNLPSTSTAPSLADTLTTERLLLRAATPADAGATWQYRGLVGVNEWLDGPLPDQQSYTDHFTDPSRLASTVIVEVRDQASGAAGDVIGDLMLSLTDAWSQREVRARAHLAQAELGWVLDPARTGRGYATEAVLALLRHCFVDLGVHRVTAECFLDNEHSWRLMERVGMRREAHARRDALHRSGRWLDSVTYAALTDEWLAKNPPPPAAPTTREERS